MDKVERYLREYEIAKRVGLYDVVMCRELIAEAARFVPEIQQEWEERKWRTVTEILDKAVSIIKDKENFKER